jgi:nitroreductase
MLIAIKAVDLGLGTCWVASFDKSKVQRILRLPDSTLPFVIMTVGYSGEKSLKKNMNPLSAMVFFDTYGNKLKTAEDGFVKTNIKKIKQLLMKK